ncbi:hypothetical protein J2Z42_002506 [Clostridium algifaecis]|uniref:Uncharacterized protein n=1 Tax=Clostridium algifaecis TaxID=1472040 RepID=A0ABS4KUT0_9CLOT|nr:hypothetical protein [Clostridium algifaecis]MBP2033799.1 hypothetical protein [Clostridium algifaecis]
MKKTIFKARIVLGMLASSFISVVIANKLSGRGSIYLKKDLNFKNQYINNIITREVTIIDILSKKILLCLVQNV